MSAPSDPHDPSLPRNSNGPDPDFKPAAVFVPGTPEYEALQRELLQGSSRPWEQR